jgi:hypothetical protein
MKTRSEILTALNEGVCIVNFTKQNGESRVMQCTLNEAIVPPAEKADPLTQKKVRSVSEEVVVCWDIEKEGWRSFRMDSVNAFDSVAI